MAIRGERIGDAYVRVRADGSSIGDDVRKDFDDLGDDFEKFGKEHSETYDKAFREEHKRQWEKTNHQLVKDMEDSFGESFAKTAARMDRLTKPLEASIRKRLRETFDDKVVEKSMDDLRRALVSGDLDLAEANVWDKIRHIAESNSKAMLHEQVRLNDQRVKELIAGDQHWADEEDRIRKGELARLRADILSRSEADAAETKRVASEFNALTQRINEFRKSGSTSRRVVKDLRGDISKLSTRMHEAGKVTEDVDHAFGEMRKGIKAATPGLHTISNSFARVAKTFNGRPRNDFFNAVLLGFRGILKAATLATRGIETFFGFITPGLRNATQNFEQFEAAAEGALVNLSAEAVESTFSWATLLSSIASGAIVFAAGAAFVAVFTAALSGLAAVVVALAASVGFALVGAVVALGGTLLPIIASVGVLVLAFKSLGSTAKERMDALKKAMGPLADEFKRLGKIAFDVLSRDFSKWAKELKPILAATTPVVKRLAGVIRDQLGNAINGLNSRPWRKFGESMSTFLPNATEKLGTIFGHVFTAFAGIIRASLPLVNRFLNWLQDITGEFAKWANSAEGQKKLHRFFRQAGAAAASLGKFLSKATEALFKLIQQTTKTGNSIIDDMANAAEEFVHWLSSPEGKKSIKDWMKFAKDFADEMGKVVKSAINLMDALDNPDTRATVLDILHAIAATFNFFAKFPGLVALLGGQLGIVFALWQQIKGAVSAVWGVIKQFHLDTFITAPIMTAVHAFETLFGAISKISNIGHGGGPLAGLLGAMNPLIGGLELVKHAFGKADEARGTFTKGTSTFAGLLKVGKDAVDSFRSSFDALTGAITGATRQLALNELQQALPGLLQVTSKLGLSARTVAAAAVGQAGALHQVFNAARQNKDVLGALGITMKQLRQTFGNVTDGVRQAQKEFRRNLLVGQDLKFLYDKFPKKLATKIDAVGIVPTTKGIANLLNKYNLTRKQVRTIIKETGADTTLKKVTNLAGRLKEVNDIPVNPKFDADDKPALAKVLGFTKVVNAAGKLHPTPKLDVLGGPQANAVVAGVRANLINLNGNRADTYIYTHHVDIYSQQGSSPSGGHQVTPKPTVGGDGTPRAIVPGNGKTVNATINVTTPTSDPRAVAAELINQLAGAGY